MNKNFQETASLSIVLSLFIPKISSKHDRDTTASILNLSLINASHITRITLAKMSAIFYLQARFLDTFRYAANEFQRLEVWAYANVPFFL